MTMGAQPKRVVAVSGLSGAGKTRVVRRAAELLGNASILYFDDYAHLSTFPQDLGAWLDAGADPNVFQTPDFARDVQALRIGQSVILPSGKVVTPAEVLLIEEPFGRMRTEMASLIDFAVFLDAPFDILLARRLVRRLEEEREEIGEGFLDVLQADLHHHLGLGRRLHLAAHQTLSAESDLVIDSSRPLDEVVSTFMKSVF